jgi:hypothetical protein
VEGKHDCRCIVVTLKTKVSNGDTRGKDVLDLHLATRNAEPFLRSHDPCDSIM